MDQDLWYHSPSANRDFGLQKAPHLHAASAFRGHEWSYTLGAHHLSGQSRRAREAQVDAYPADPAAFDDFMLAADADMANGTPGTVFAKTGDGVWQQRATVTKAEQVNHFLAENADIRLTVVLLDGVWLKYGKKLSFSPRLSAGDGMDMGFDLAAPAGSTVRATGLAVKGLPDGEFGTTRAFQLNALFTPADTTNRRLAWSSDNPDVATVSDNGLLMLTGKDGSFNLSCLWSGDTCVQDYTGYKVSYDTQGEGTLTSLGATVWPKPGDVFNRATLSDDGTILTLDVESSEEWLNYVSAEKFRIDRPYRFTADVRVKSGSPSKGFVSFAMWSQQSGWYGAIADGKALNGDWRGMQFLIYPDYEGQPVKDDLSVRVSSALREDSACVVQLRNPRMTPITTVGGGR